MIKLQLTVSVNSQTTKNQFQQWILLNTKFTKYASMEVKRLKPWKHLQSTRQGKEYLNKNSNKAGQNLKRCQVLILSYTELPNKYCKVT